MPNWVNNEMRFKKEDAAKILRLPEGETNYCLGEVDFNLMVPMPESLNIESGSSNSEDIYLYLSDKLKKTPKQVKNLPNSGLIDKWFWSRSERIVELAALVLENSAESKEIIEKKYEIGKQLVENYEKYGATTWYDWCYKNWGVKWNAGQTDVVETKECYEVSFNTPWGPPMDWLKALCNAGINCYVEWHEEQGYHGEIICKNGVLTENALEFEGYDYEEDEEYDDYDEAEVE